jgi:RNA polymerase sigma factor (sigma-70 family)
MAENQQNENFLIEGLAKQNALAINTIYKENYPMVQSLITKNNGTEDDAKDIFQEAMVILYEKSKNTDFRLTSKISTYLYSISRHLWLKKLQKLGKMPIKNVEYAEEIIENEDEINKIEEKEQALLRMEQAIEKLGEPCRSLIKAFYIEKSNMQAIAERFGYTNAENAKTQKYKCFVRLKKIFFENNIK